MEHSFKSFIVDAAPFSPNDRPCSVIGPQGEKLTRDMLPPVKTRWTARRKAEVVAAVRGGMLLIDEVCAIYTISSEEFDAWDRAIGRGGLGALRVTRIQQYRDLLKGY